MKNENIFRSAKSHYENSFNNLEHFYSENKKTVRHYIDELESTNPALERDYGEWLENAAKGLSDYKDLVLKGLDYLSHNLEKNIDKPIACAS